MAVSSSDWQQRVDALWARIDDCAEEAFVAEMRALAGERPEGDALALFELAGAYDSTGHPDVAVPLYEAALAAGLPDLERSRTIVQYSSSLRNLGQPQRAVDLLTEELQRPPGGLTNAVRTFLALALVDAGREREAVSVALTALSEYLPRYNRSVARYALELLE